MILANLLFKLYAINIHSVRKAVLNISKRLEGSEEHSKTLRRLFKEYYGVEVGMYTHGGCFIPGQVDRQTSIGRYCSLARSIRIINRNHPMDFKSMHAFFFNPGYGYCDKDSLEYVPLVIGNDVWIGHNTIIVPKVRKIGDGAVIGAGAVVTKDIPPYAVVVGNPARVVRFRFSKEIIDELLASKWWETDIKEIKTHIHEYQRPYELNNLIHAREDKEHGS